jgi:hypothetical protein
MKLAVRADLNTQGLRLGVSDRHAKAAEQTKSSLFYYVGIIAVNGDGGGGANAE